MRAFILLAILGCAGCVQFGHVGEKTLVGSYWNGDGFCPRTLELRADGSFDYDQLTDLIKEGKDGVGVFEGSWGIRGRWRLIPPDRIEMTSDKSAQKIGVFVRTYSGGKIAILEPDLFPDILKVWTPAESVYFLRKRSKAPNSERSAAP
jgi:hypothetical protein